MWRVRLPLVHERVVVLLDHRKKVKLFHIVQQPQMANLGLKLGVEVLASVDLMLVLLDLILPVLFVEASLAPELRCHHSPQLLLFLLQFLASLLLLVIDQFILPIEVSVATV